MDLHPTRDLVLKKLRDCFPDPRLAGEALAILDSYGEQPWHRERERVQLGILMLSEGSLKGLRQQVGLADRDYRDLLVGAEFPEEFQASSKTPAEEMAAIRRRDRERYENWVRSGST